MGVKFMVKKRYVTLEWPQSEMCERRPWQKNKLMDNMRRDITQWADGGLLGTMAGHDGPSLLGYGPQK